MEIILRESMPSLGKAGDVVKVADGYARNFLVPRGKAVLANRKNVAHMERQRAWILARAAKQMKELEALATQLGKLDVEIQVRVGEGERLYGSVTSMDIAEAIERQHGYSVDRRKIILDEPIKSLGEHEVPVKLGGEVTAIVRVNIVPYE
jgi:large subunit ribosomal protein L9